MRVNYDAIMIGAGPAGCAAAYDLAGAGKRVLLIDKCQFPRLKPCAGALTVKTLRALRFDIEPTIKRICGEMKLSLGMASRILSDQKPIAAMTVRQEFDQFVLNHCLERGVEFKPDHRLMDLRRESENWIVTTNHGSFHARFLIGADGANSQVRKILTPQNPIRFGVALETCIPTNRPDNWEMEFDFGAIDHGYGWVFPKHDHLNVGLYTLNPTAPHAKAQLHDFVARKTGEQISAPIHGHKIPYGARSIRHGWKTACLIGDAAGMIDPFLGEGIHNAIRSGQLAARAIIDARESPIADFDAVLEEIRRDLASYDSETRRFYANVRRGYRRLTRWPLGKALVKGFSRGWTVSRIKRKFAVLALT